MKRVNKKMKSTAKNNYADGSKNEMETVGARLSIFLDKIGASRNDIAKDSGVVFSTVSNYLDKDELPGPKFLAHLVKKHRVNVDWLLSGRGPMTLAEQERECLNQVAGATDDRQGQILQLKHELADKDRELAAVERALGKQQSLILDAVRKACRELGLTADQTRALQWAVMDYDGAMDPGQAAEQDAAVSHQKAVGDD